jgi:hypothetical protein
MTSATPLKGFGLRAAMVYAALVVIMNPIFGPPATLISRTLGPLTNPFAAALGLGGFPLQGEFALRLLLGLIGGGMWWLLERDRIDDSTMLQALIVELRFALAAGMIWFGIGHLFGVLTPWPSQADWIRPLREMDAPHYMTVWVGSSVLHKVSLGMSHLLAGVCLLSRRTTLLGAILGVGVVGNEALTQLSFGDFRTGDYWLYFELSAMAAALILVDARRLMTVLTHDEQPVPPPLPGPTWPSGWLAKLAAHARPIALTLLLLINLPTVVRAFDQHNKSSIAGVYRVESYKLDGRDSLTGRDAASRWMLVAIDHCSRFAARAVDGRQFEGAIALPDAGFLRRRACAKATSTETGTLNLTKPDSMPPATALPALEGTVTYARTTAGLDIEAKLAGMDIVARMRRIPDSAFRQFEFLGEGW